MKKNSFVVVIGIFFLCNLLCVLEDRSVQSVLPAKNIQRRANVGGICNPYVDHNYYFYEGEVALFHPQSFPQYQAPWNSTTCLYDENIIRAYESRPLKFDGNETLGAYYGPFECEALVLEAIKVGKTDVTLIINGSISIKISVVVLNSADDYLEKMDKEAFFTAINKSDYAVFDALLQRGASLFLVNEKNETVVVALAKSGHIPLIRAAISQLYSLHDYSTIMDLLHALVAQDNAFAIVSLLQGFPLDVLKKSDSDGSLQNYINKNAVLAAIENNEYDMALSLLQQGYSIVSALNDKGLNPLLSAIIHGDEKIALKCIEIFSAQDLGVTDLQGHTPLMVALQSWKSDKEQKKYAEVVEKLLAKMEPKDLVCKDLLGKSAWDYSTVSSDPEFVVLVKKYIKGTVSLDAQEIVNRIQAFAPKGVWTTELLDQATQFIATIQDLGSRDAGGNTALMLALQQHKHYVSKLLIENTPFPLLVTVNRKNQSVLQIAQQWDHKKLVELIMKRIKNEEREYFYDGIEGTCSGCLYVPDLEKKRGVMSVVSCVKGVGGEKSSRQELQLGPLSYLYNGGGRLVVLDHPVANVFYTPRRLSEVFGMKDIKAAVQHGYKEKLTYTTALAFLQLTPREVSEVDPRGEIKEFVGKTGYFAAAVEHDPFLVQALITARYSTNILNIYEQNPAMTAFQHKSVEIGKKLFPLLASSSYGQQDTSGNTLLMYVIEAGQKDIATEILEAMNPVDLIKTNKKGKTVYEMLLTAQWKDLLEILRQKTSQLSLFYTALSEFSYVPNAQGNGGSFTKIDKGVTGAITAPNQLIYLSSTGKLATVAMNQPVNGLAWSKWTAQNGILISALKSYSTMRPASFLTPGLQSSLGQAKAG